MAYPFFHNLHFSPVEGHLYLDGINPAGRILKLVRLSFDYALDLQSCRLKVARHLFPLEQSDVNRHGLAVPFVFMEYSLAPVKG